MNKSKKDQAFEVTSTQGEGKTDEARSVKPLEKASFTFGVFGQNMVFAFISAYIMIFYTDVVGISSAAVGTLLFAARMWDAVNDPLMGIITERTRTRWGKFRPYMLFVSVPIVLIMYLIFTPGVIGSALVWAYISYFLFDIVYTVSDIPLWSLTSVMSKSPNERTGLISLGKMIAPVSFILVSVVTVPLLQVFGYDANAYRIVAVIYGIMMALGMLAIFFNTRERVEHSSEKLPVKEILSSLKKNKPLLHILASQLFITTVDNLVTSMIIYYATYNLLNANMASVLSLAMIIPMMIGIALASKLSAKHDKKMLLIAALVIRVVGYIVLFIIGYSNAVVLIIGFALVSLTFGGPEILLPAMMVETIDYIQWKTGKRTEGIMWSTQTFIVKLGSSLAGIILGYLLTYVKYVPNVAQTEATLFGMHGIFTLVPGILVFLSILPMVSYPLTMKLYQKIIKELN
ncbi:MAG: MFS transporter [Clostridiaceae bacterium]|jgi:sugar (glycoside-pentoside-hexuronide) transporter|nr:MFS transporter [Clostridiaceae bacterium]